MCITNWKQREITLFSCYWDKDLSRTAQLEIWFLTPAPNLTGCISLHNLALCYDQKSNVLRPKTIQSFIWYENYFHRTRIQRNILTRSQTHIHTPPLKIPVRENLVLMKSLMETPGFNCLHKTDLTGGEGEQNFSIPHTPRLTICLQLLASSRRFPTRGPPGATIYGL